VDDKQTLYTEIKPEMQAITSRLFDLSKKFLQTQGDFLPHAAVLTAEFKLELVGAQGENELTTAAEILPLLHGGLRGVAKQKALSAIGIAESVIVTRPGQSSSKAIKVLLEHRRGLTVAFYMPYQKKLLRGYVYEPVFSILAEPEVNAW
jgi:hypothetical protein